MPAPGDAKRKFAVTTMGKGQGAEVVWFLFDDSKFIEREKVRVTNRYVEPCHWEGVHVLKGVFCMCMIEL